MPTDSNGVYSLPAGYLAVDGTTIQPSQHNPALEDIEESMTLRVMRTGVTPMTGPLKGYAGTAAAPSFVTSGAPTTGWFPTTDGVGIAVSGVQVAEFTSAGLKTGGRYLGELIPYSGLTAPALTVQPYGQTLSRTTYAALWAFAQTEIAGGSTFYNNGNGSTTFGIGDLRGRMPVCRDDLGGVAASRVTSAGSGIDATSNGSTGGAQSSTLALTNLPAQPAPTGTVTVTGTGTPVFKSNGVVVTILGGAGAGGDGVQAGTGVLAATTANATFTGTAPTGQNATAFTNMPPVIVIKYLLFAGA